MSRIGTIETHNKSKARPFYLQSGCKGKKKPECVIQKAKVVGADMVLVRMTDNVLEDRRRILKGLIESKAFLRRAPGEKPFELASGGTSDIFFDCKRVTQDPQGIVVVAEVIFEMVKDYNLDGIGGIVHGSIPISTAVAQLSFLKGSPIPSFWVRQEPKKHGLKNLIGGKLQPGSRVVILDDVTTQGGSVGKAVDAVLKRNCEIVELITMVDREKGARKRFEDMGIKFTSIFKMSDFVTK